MFLMMKIVSFYVHLNLLILFLKGELIEQQRTEALKMLKDGEYDYIERFEDDFDEKRKKSNYILFNIIFAEKESELLMKMAFLPLQLPSLKDNFSNFEMVKFNVFSSVTSLLTNMIWNSRYVDEKLSPYSLVHPFLPPNSNIGFICLFSLIIFTIVVMKILFGV
jgi:hypothetical protein